MRVRFVKKKEIPVADTPGYQSTRVMAGVAWNGRACAAVYLYRVDHKFGTVVMAAQLFARRDQHLDVGRLPYLDEVEDLPGIWEGEE